MTNEIRFRAFSKPDKVMIYDLNSPYLYHGKLISFEADILMRGLGLRDIKGKHIYEGDIVKCHNNHNIAIVKWENELDYVGFCLKIIKMNPMVIGFSYELYQKLEVIGNIHENPELLEKNMDEYLIKDKSK